MRVADELTGPIGYSGWLLALGLGCGLAVAGGAAFLVWWALRSDARPATPAPRDTDLRRETLDHLDGIRAELAAGRLEPRAAADGCSRLVRAYVSDVTGRPVTSMTLADLRGSGVPGLPELVAVLYPPQFAPDVAEGTLALVDRAREVVATWS